MASRSEISPRGRSVWWVALVVAGLGATLAWFVAGVLHYLYDWSVTSFTPYYWGRRFGLLAHLVPGMVASGVGLMQIWLGLTGRLGRLHRVLGRVYVGAVALGCCGGVYLALTIPGHPAYAAGLFFLAVAWAMTTTMAVLTIRARRIVDHRNWMLRSYTVTFGFVLFRLVDLLLHLVIMVPADPVADPLDTLMAWACWAVPLLVIDFAIQLKALRRG